MGDNTLICNSCHRVYTLYNSAQRKASKSRSPGPRCSHSHNTERDKTSEQRWHRDIPLSFIIHSISAWPFQFPAHLRKTWEIDLSQCLEVNDATFHYLRRYLPKSLFFFLLLFFSSPKRVHLGKLRIFSEQNS